MSLLNIYTPTGYDERVIHLALGVEPRSALDAQRLDAGVDVRWERYPRPVDEWRQWRRGETLTTALPRLHRQRSGRFARRYDEGTDANMDIRVVDDERSGSLRIGGRGRRIVPRRLRVAIAAESVVVAAEADPITPPHPIWRRTFPVECFPGAAADLASGSTVIRGRILRSDAIGALVPVRWARVLAETMSGVEVGWAHGDDRGEFVLVVRPSAGNVTVPADPIPVVLSVGAALPPPDPDPLDPLLAQIDPLWDLPLETVVASPLPGTEPTLTGRRFLPEHAIVSPLVPPQPLLVAHGRQVSVTVRVT
jgi:hypothetical protein